MRHLAVFLALLFGIRYGRVKAQTVTWKFPTLGEDLKANTKDTVLFDWTSTLPETLLRMWCTTATDSIDRNLASSFSVDSNGPFKYVMDNYKLDDVVFPVTCHGELAADPNSHGPNSPARIVWTSDPAQTAKTISKTQSTVISTPPPSSTPIATSSSSVTPIETSSSSVALIETPSSSVTPVAKSSSSVTSIAKHSSSVTPIAKPSTSVPPSSTTNTNPGRASTTGHTSALPSKSSDSPSGARPEPQPSPSAAASSSPDNLGAKIGGAIGGIALICFIILALLFLRKYKRDQAPSSPIASEASNRGSLHSLVDFSTNRGGFSTNREAEALDMVVFEKDGYPPVYETDGHPVQVHRVHEAQGSTAWNRTTSRGNSWVDGVEAHAWRNTPVELPAGSNYLPNKLRIDDVRRGFMTFDAFSMDGGKI